MSERNPSDVIGRRTRDVWRRCRPMAIGFDDWQALLSAAFGVENRPFKRASDPHGCPERSHSCVLGTRMHCRLEAGHRPLGHDFVAMIGAADPDWKCGHGWIGVGKLPCGQNRTAHGTPHAMEVSAPYVLEHDDTVASRHVPAQEQRG